jgi:hypothetical protein
MGNSAVNSNLTLTNVSVYNISKNSVSHAMRVVCGRLLTTSNLRLTNTSFHNSLATSLRMTAFIQGVSGGPLLTYKNCIFSDESAAPLSVSTGCTVTSITYCDFYGTDVPTSTFSIASDPLFVDPANGNFNLRPSSPCIDTGTLV